MIIAPNRNFPLIDKQGFVDDRLSEWMEEVSTALNPALQIAHSHIIDAARGDAALTYSEGLLTLVTYADASTKTFSYEDGLLVLITDSAASNIEFVYNDGELSGVNFT